MYLDNQRVLISPSFGTIVNLRVVRNESKVADKVLEPPVLFGVDVGLDGAHGDRLLDHIVVVGENALVDLSVEDLGRVMVTGDRSSVASSLLECYLLHPGTYSLVRKS